MTKTKCELTQAKFTFAITSLTCKDAIDFIKDG